MSQRDGILERSKSFVLRSINHLWPGDEGYRALDLGRRAEICYLKFDHDGVLYGSRIDRKIEVYILGVIGIGGIYVEGYLTIDWIKW